MRGHVNGAILHHFLNKNDSLIRFSWILNNQMAIIKEDQKLLGYTSDIEILYILDALINHPSIEIIQIVQTLTDF